MFDADTRKVLSDFFRDMGSATRVAADVARAPSPGNAAAMRDSLARTLATVDRLSAAVEQRPA